MGINTIFKMNADDDMHVAQSTLESLPKIGETIWFYPSGKQKACIVTDVCHMVSLEVNNNYHDATIYLEEI